MMHTTLRAVAVGLMISGACASGQMFNDFEAGTVGSAYGFRTPNVSGTTGTNLATSPASSMTVVAGHDANTTQVGQFQFNFADDATTRWVRLTTSGAVGVPNPLLDLNQALQFDIYSVNPIEVAVGIRETGGSGPVGANGGSTGTIEWVAADRSAPNGSIAPGGIAVTPGVWQTITIDLRGSPVYAFTGNGTLTGDWGVFESLAVTSGGSAAQTIYVDNFQVVPVPEPGTMAFAGLGLLLMGGCWIVRRR